MYRLKKGQESITIVDGPDAGRNYARGKTFDAPAAGYEHLFTKIKTTDSQPNKPGKKDPARNDKKEKKS